MTDAVSTVLHDGELRVVGRLVDASNATLFGYVNADDTELAVVYKPVQGERPLWDFPDGTLAAREYATALVDEALGWHTVPATTLRDGPFGPGMVQQWMDVDDSVDLVALVQSNHPTLRRIAVLDAVVNNADRKGGHLLPLTSGEVMAIDHGVTFHEEPKLRTLLWQWQGEAVPADVIADLERLADQLGTKSHPGPLGATLAALLTSREVSATRRRVRRLVETGLHPSPSPDWPAYPWPPF
jgi:hypothetical protein